MIVRWNLYKLCGTQKLLTNEFGYNVNSRRHDLTSVERYVHQSRRSFMRDVAKRQRHIIQLMHSFDVRIRICQPEKVMFTEVKQFSHGKVPS